LVHPEMPEARGLLYIQFFEPARRAGASLRNAVVVAPAGLDRSPCGTGTSARLANLWAGRTIAVGQRLVHESVIGRRFEPWIAAPTRVGPYDGVLPEIARRARLAGMNQLVLQ